jgi:hypothetical protein
MTTRCAFFIGLTVVALATELGAQTATTTREAGKPAYQVTQLNGQVVAVDNNLLIARMIPGNKLRYFNITPGRKFIIDGEEKQIGDLKPGTTLSATIVTKTVPVTVRTETVTNAKVLYVNGNYVIAMLENGETRDFNLPPSFTFTADGKQATVKDLKRDMRISAQKVVSEPQTEISTLTLVTGKAPKS